MEEVTITIVGWEKYQGEAKRYKKTSWFRMDNNMYTHRLWDALNPSELKLYLFLLCQMSQHSGSHLAQQSTITIPFRTLVSLSRIRSGRVRSGLDRLETTGLVSYQIVKIPIHSACTVLRTNERTLRTEEVSSLSEVGQFCDVPEEDVSSENGFVEKGDLKPVTIPDHVKKMIDAAKGGDMGWWNKKEKE